MPERAELQTYNAKYFARGRRDMSDYKNLFKTPLVVKSKQELVTEELPSLSCKDSSVAPLPQCGGDQLGKLVAQPDFGAR